MKPEIKITAALADDNPDICHLTADRDLDSKAPPQHLLHKILDMPGVSGVHLSNGRTVVVEKHGGEDWKEISKKLGKLIREHLIDGDGDARKKGPKGHTKFGATLENLWGYHRQCDRYAVKMKSELTKDRKYALLALGATSLFGLLAAEHFLDVVFGLLGGVAAGVGAYYTKRSSSPEKEHQWVKSRAMAEDAKSEAIKFMVRADPYDKEDAVARLAQKAAQIRQEMADLAEFDDLDKDARLTGLPESWWTMDDYLLERVKDQSDWYGRKSRTLHKEAEHLKQLIVLFGIGAAVLGATRVIVGQLPNGSPDLPMNKYGWDQFETLIRTWGAPAIAELVKAREPVTVAVVRFLKLLGSASWLPVLTSLTGAVTTFNFQNRLDFTSLVYKQTRGKLESALAEWNDQVKDADKPARQSEYIRKFEKILNQEHAQWITELDKSAAPGGGSNETIAPPGVD